MEGISSRSALLVGAAFVLLAGGGGCVGRNPVDRPEGAFLPSLKLGLTRDFSFQPPRGREKGGRPAPTTEAAGMPPPLSEIKGAAAVSPARDHGDQDNGQQTVSVPESALRFDLFVQDMAAATFFQGLVKDDPMLSMVVHPQVKGSISLELKGVTVDEVVEVACDLYHFECHAFGDPSGRRRGYKILPWQLVTRTYRVDFLPISRDGWSSTSINAVGVDPEGQRQGQQGNATSSSNIQTRYDADFWSDLEDSLRSILNLDLVTTSVRDTLDRAGLKSREVERKPFDSQYDTMASLREEERLRQESDQRIFLSTNDKKRIRYKVAGRPADVDLELDDAPWQGGRRVKRQLKNMMVNRQSGLVTVRAYPKDHRDIQAFLDHLRQRSQRQVILEAKILEVTLSDATQLGVDWLAINRGLGSAGVAPLLSEPYGAATFLQNKPVFDGAGTLTHYEESRGPAVILSKAAMGTPFGLAIRNHDFVGFISLLKRQGEVQILSSPRIATLNNQKAVIKVGQDEVFITGMRQGSVTNDGKLGNTVTMPTPIFEKMFTGVSLDVTPQIGDDGEVTLHVHPLITEVKDVVKTFDVNNQLQTLPLALSQTRETDSIVRVNDGEVAVIGGLMRKKKSKDEDKVPLLGDIPGLGRLFRRTSHASATGELVILIRPVIVGGQNPWPTDPVRSLDFWPK